MDEPASVLDCLNAKSPKLLKVVLHGLELFGGVALPVRDLACNPKRIRNDARLVSRPPLDAFVAETYRPGIGVLFSVF